MDNTTYLMEKLFSRNANDPEHGGQKIGEEEDHRDEIMMLDCSFRKLSPMLKSRFEYASSWKNANLDQDWLSLKEISEIYNNEIAREWLNLRRENWSENPPKSISASHCAHFALNPYEPEEAYFVWIEEIIEPQVWRYFGADYKMFLNLDRFLEYLVGEREKDDTGR